MVIKSGIQTGAKLGYSANGSHVNPLISDLSNFTAYRTGSVYEIRFSLVDKNGTLQGSDFTGHLQIIDLENNTLYQQMMNGKASDFQYYSTDYTGQSIYAYMTQIDESSVHSELATSPEVARAQAYVGQAMQRYGSQSIQVEQANEVLQQTKQLASESLTAIIDVEIPNGRTFTNSAPVIG
jgi:hypothetical protein